MKELWKFFIQKVQHMLSAVRSLLPESAGDCEKADALREDYFQLSRPTSSDPLQVWEDYEEEKRQIRFSLYAHGDKCSICTPSLKRTSPQTSSPSRIARQPCLGIEYPPKESA